MEVSGITMAMDARMSKGNEMREFLANCQLPRERTVDGLLFASRNLVMAALLEGAKRAAGGDTTILLTGESGTGKDALARRIHRWSPRRGRAFVVINCTNLAEQLFENELFGHLRGAFTGASNDQPGRLEAAEGGTVLFDEIAELPTSLQGKFLRFVEDRSFERVGGGHTINADVRLIAASNRNLEAEVVAGRFREDLFYRINVITFSLPPLRDRTQDILPLARAVLREISLRLNRAELSLAAEVAEALVTYRWPGNLRELHNVLERAATLTGAQTITLDDLPESVRHPGAGAGIANAHDSKLKDLEREHILIVLGESATLGQAAATLGIAVTTLWRKRKQYRIE
jgi:transcriptional regulator with PAS, ATPase and Fis domain